MKIVVFLTQMVLLLATELLHVYGGLGGGECRQVLHEASDVMLKSKRPPKLYGHWTSSSCETRPGPEFVLRKYSFRRKYFLAQLYYYADDECSKVTHFISAKGNVKTTRPSWLTQSAYHSKYSLSKVTVIPYTHEKAVEFQNLMRRFCKDGRKDKTPTRIKVNNKFKILKFLKSSAARPEFEDDFDCTKLFNFTMNELQLIHVDKRKVELPSQRSATKKVVRLETQLFVGDISTNVKYRMRYRPTHFQAPLKKAKASDCSVCQAISRASQRHPPILEKRFVFPVDIYGDWVSERCETRPSGQFLTRHLTFLTGSSAWQGIYTFYRDPRCTEAHFRLEVKGTYVKGNRSRLIPSAYEYLFRTLRLKVTPLDFQMVQYLNSYDGKECGKSNAWRLGSTQDVTRTKGCMTLGIFLPNIEYELMKAQYHDRNSYLFVGQRSSDYASMSLANNRPTSFQGPLIKCGVQNEAVVSSTFDFYEEFPVAASYTSSLNLEATGTTDTASHSICVIKLMIACLTFALSH